MTGEPSLLAHCDFLNTTVPYDHTANLASELLDACGPAGISIKNGDCDGVWRIGPDQGTLTLKRRGPVMVCGLSGSAIAALRKRLSCWLDVLTVLASYPHRVTRLDAAFDLRIDAPPVLWELYQRGKRSGLRLGRAASPVKLAYWGPGSTGADTGTIYIGGKKAELKARVYDKRQERIDAREPDPGPWVRYEVTVTAAHEVSLADAQSPTALFWHFAHPALLRLPAGASPPPPWVPAGFGFQCPPREPRTAMERLIRYLDSTDIIQTLCKFAAACGPHGALLVIERLKAALQVGGEGGPPPSEAVAPSSTAESQSGNRRPSYAEFKRARDAAGW